MPWAKDVGAIIEAWYPGVGGADALADLLFGSVDFSGKLPVSFARRDADLPHPEVIGMNAVPVPRQVTFTRDGHTLTRTVNAVAPYDVDYNKAGAAVGYKWFEAQHLQPLFAFGFGLSYTTYEYSDLRVDSNGRAATVTIKNIGRRPGTEIVQIYARLPARAVEPYKRLVAFERVTLTPGESKTVTLELSVPCLSVFNPNKDAMEQIPGRYQILAGPSSADTPLVAFFDRAGK
jgi:beta-glucosidase